LTHKDPTTGVGELNVPPSIHRNVLGLGSFPLIASYPGTLQTDPSEDTATVTIAKDPTTTTVSVTPGTVQGGSSAMISATVAPPPALPLASVVVTHPMVLGWALASGSA
jgi:hypothetical protein